MPKKNKKDQTDTPQAASEPSEAPNKWEELAKASQAQEEAGVQASDAASVDDAVGDTEDAVPESALQTAHAHIETLKAEAKEAALRHQAALHNVEQRMNKQVEKAHLYANKKLLEALLPVADSLDRALEAGTDEQASVQALHEGVDLTRGMLEKIFVQFGVEKIAPAAGDAFDPERHEAMSVQPNPDLPAGAVVHLLQPGYALNGRVVRAAMVMVNQ